MNTKAELVKLGMLFDKKYTKYPKKIDLKMLARFRLRNAEEEFFEACEEIQNSEPKVNPLLLAVKSKKEYALLQSHDAETVLLSYEFCLRVIKKLNPESIIDVGCGGGFFPYLLNTASSESSYLGVDYLDNLLKIGKDICPENKFVKFDYFSSDDNIVSEAKFIVANRPFSCGDLQLEEKPHDISEFEGVTICPNCALSLREALIGYLENVGKLAPYAESFLQIQRLSLTEDYVGFIMAFEDSGWYLSNEHSRILSIKSTDEQIAALFFTREEAKRLNENEIIRWMNKNGWQAFIRH